MRRVKASHPFFAAPLLSLAISVLVLFIRLVDMDSESRAAVYGVVIILQLAVFCVPSVVFCGFRGRGYIGRLGPLTVASLWYFSRGERVRFPEGNIAIG